MSHAFSQRLKEFAEALGFSMLGIVPAEPSPRLAAYLDWIKAGMHGEMGYLAREDRIVRRQDLSVIVPGARSIIIAGLDYYTLKLPDDIALNPLRGRISNYAWAADYHEVMLPRLEQLADYLRSEIGTDAATRAYVDTGAVQERSHAEHAGMGFVGKNTMLIRPRQGSFFFLGEIITDAVLDYDGLSAAPAMPGCGSCTRCLAACPTSAFPRPYVLDARRCISYLTIELKGYIPLDLRPLMGNWVYGCDVCQDVCPWQRFAKPQWDSAFQPLDFDRAVPPLTTLLQLDERRFADLFGGSPIYRIKRDRMVRNACIAAGNSAHPALSTYLMPLLRDQSALVRGHAAWALGELRQGHRELLSALQTEVDVQVQAEIRQALHTA
jgi:epoxyqueuosine reductase